MLLFKKSKRKEESETGTGALAFVKKYEALKQRFAKWLQLKFNKLSHKRKVYSLVMFSILCSITSVSIIVHAAQSREQNSSLVSGKTRNYPLKDRQIYLQADSIISKNEYWHVVQFKNHLFSLKQDSAGRKQYDSIVMARPHLVDSIYLLEEMYLHQ